MRPNPQQYQSPTPQFPPYLMHPAYHGGLGSPSPFAHHPQFMVHPSSGMGSPMSSSPSTPSTQSFSGQNSIPFPFTDRTNTPTQPPPQVGDKRKRTSALSGNSRPLKGCQTGSLQHPIHRSLSQLPNPAALGRVSHLQFPELPDYLKHHRLVILPHISLHPHNTRTQTSHPKSGVIVLIMPPMCTFLCDRSPVLQLRLFFQMQAPAKTI